MDTIVKARVNSDDKDVAVAVLKEMGMNLSDLIRMVVVQTAKTRRVPLNLELSPESLSAIQEVEEGRARKASRTVLMELPEGPPTIAKVARR